MPIATMPAFSFLFSTAFIAYFFCECLHGKSIRMTKGKDWKNHPITCMQVSALRLGLKIEGLRRVDYFLELRSNMNRMAFSTMAKVALLHSGF
jgi:hypothetical protein